MTAPVCGARTWVAPDEMATCEREHGHDGKHQANASFAHLGWREAVCRLVVVPGSPNQMEYALPAQATRDIVASLQAQLDALDPDAAIAEAERRAVEMFHHYRGLCGLADRRRYIVGASCSSLELIDAAKERASEEHDAALETWLALVEARGARREGRWSVSEETCATSDDAFYDRAETNPIDPKPPIGDGWRLVCAVLCPANHERSARAIWYWERVAKGGGA